ncbi:MAG: F0F1 ATP synthase subunit B [Pirellulales bacterium]
MKKSTTTKSPVRCLAAVLIASAVFGGGVAPCLAVEKHAADADHGSASTDPLSVDPDLSIWTAIVFVVLLAVLWKFAWGPISEALDKRERTIGENIAAAERAGDDARRLIAQYEAKLASAADEVRQLLEEARRDADHTRQEIVAEARVAAKAEHDRQMREVQTAIEAALKTLAERSATLAVELAGKIVRRELKPQEHESLIRETVQKFPLAQPGKN